MLLVDDDEPFLKRLARAMEKRGFRGRNGGKRSQRAAAIGGSASAGLRGNRPQARRWKTVSMSSRPSGSGGRTARVVVLTGYGAIATAVAAVKVGARRIYLSKPADANDVNGGTSSHRRRNAAAAGKPDVGGPGVRWEHIQRVYELCDRNVSENRKTPQHAPSHPAAYSWRNARRADPVRPHPIAARSSTCRAVKAARTSAG